VALPGGGPTNINNIFCLFVTENAVCIGREATARLCQYSFTAVGTAVSSTAVQLGTSAYKLSLPSSPPVVYNFVVLCWYHLCRDTFSCQPCHPPTPLSFQLVVGTRAHDVRQALQAAGAAGRLEPRTRVRLRRDVVVAIVPSCCWPPHP
jgi:hypothetical protein